jgi:hypothetical protein
VSYPITGYNIEHNLVPPRSDKLPPPVLSPANNNSSSGGGSNQQLTVSSFNNNNNNNNNKPVSRVNATTFNNIMQRLNDFLKRRPTLESLKRDGIIKG